MMRKIDPKSVEAAATAERKEELVAVLDARVFRGLARGREANIEAGCALNELKKVLGHGKWKRHFAETFAPGGLSLRTAERYMQLAKAEANSKVDKLTTFKPARDPEAVKVRNATERAQMEAAGAAPPSPEPKQVYKLALHLSMDERNAANKLWISPCRPRAEKKIIDLLKRLFIEFHIVAKEAC
jgi:hypothetical protein